MDCKGSLLCSQVPAAGSCPELDESVSYHPMLFLLRSILICVSLTIGHHPSGLLLTAMHWKLVSEDFLLLPCCFYSLQAIYFVKSWAVFKGLTQSFRIIHGVVLRVVPTSKVRIASLFILLRYQVKWGHVVA
jgi:hypothetical protein